MASDLGEDEFEDARDGASPPPFVDARDVTCNPTPTYERWSSLAGLTSARSASRTSGGSESPEGTYASAKEGDGDNDGEGDDEDDRASIPSTYGCAGGNTKGSAKGSRSRNSSSSFQSLAAATQPTLTAAAIAAANAQTSNRSSSNDGSGSGKTGGSMHAVMPPLPPLQEPKPETAAAAAASNVLAKTQVDGQGGISTDTAAAADSSSSRKGTGAKAGTETGAAFCSAQPTAQLSIDTSRAVSMRHGSGVVSSTSGGNSKEAASAGIVSAAGGGAAGAGAGEAGMSILQAQGQGQKQSRRVSTESVESTASLGGLASGAGNGGLEGNVMFDIFFRSTQNQTPDSATRGVGSGSSSAAARVSTKNSTAGEFVRVKLNGGGTKAAARGEERGAGPGVFVDRTRLAQVLHAHVGAIYCMSFSPDGNFLATGGEDAQVIIWTIGQQQYLPFPDDDTSSQYSSHQSTGTNSRPTSGNYTFHSTHGSGSDRDSDRGGGGGGYTRGRTRTSSTEYPERVQGATGGAEVADQMHLRSASFDRRDRGGGAGADHDTGGDNSHDSGSTPDMPHLAKKRGSDTLRSEGRGGPGADNASSPTSGEGGGGSSSAERECAFSADDASSESGSDIYSEGVSDGVGGDAHAPFSSHSRCNSTSYAQFPPGTPRVDVVDSNVIIYPVPCRIYSNGHTEPILDMAWSRSNFLLTASSDQNVCLWHVSQNERLQYFVHNDIVTSVDFHPIHDRYFISGSFDGKVRMWDVISSTVSDFILTRSSAPDSGKITCVKFSPDGSKLAAGFFGGKITSYYCIARQDKYELKYATEFMVRDRKGRFSGGAKVTGLTFIKTTKALLEMDMADRAAQGYGGGAASPGSGYGYSGSGAGDGGGGGGTGAQKGQDSYMLMVTTNDNSVRLVDWTEKTTYCKYKGGVNTDLQIKASASDDNHFIISGTEEGGVVIWSMAGGDADSGCFGVPLCTAKRDLKKRNAVYSKWSSSATSKQGRAPVTVAVFAPGTAIMTLLSSADDVYTSIMANGGSSGSGAGGSSSGSGDEGADGAGNRDTDSAHRDKEHSDSTKDSDKGEKDRDHMHRHGSWTSVCSSGSNNMEVPLYMYSDEGHFSSLLVATADYDGVIRIYVRNLEQASEE